MIHGIRRGAIKLISNTPLEGASRKVYGKIVPSKGNVYDKQTMQIFKRRLSQNSNCIDVGAYRGEILKPMFKYAPLGTHFAFEPVPENAQYLASKFKQARVINKAVGDKKGKLKFHHVVGRAARSGIKKVDYPDKNQKLEVLTVEVDTLDNQIPKSTKIDLIKIDVEGGELQVLRGAKKTITKNKPVIVFEHEKVKAKIYGTDPKDVFDFLVTECGMKIYLLTNYLEEKPPLSKTDFIAHVNAGSEFYFVAK